MTSEAKKRLRLSSKDIQEESKANAAIARSKCVQAKRRRSRSSLACLNALMGELKETDLSVIAQSVIQRAREGDQKALDWLGKFVFGNGKLTLSDLSNPSILKKG